jgi:hypothetical protein
MSPEQIMHALDRACAVDGHIGLVPVADGHALVLGDEPASASGSIRSAERTRTGT